MTTPNESLFKSFKNVGVIPEVSRLTVLDRNKSLLPIGVKTPLELDLNGQNLFAMNYSLREQIADNLRNLILTNHGERLGLYNYGANLRPLLTEYSNHDNFEAEAMLRINTAITTWMPYVTPEQFGSKPDYINNQYTGIVDVVMIYSIPLLNLVGQRIDVKLFVI